jgi:hypothetical protein
MMMSKDSVADQFAVWETTFQQRVMFWTGDCGVRAADVVLQIPGLVRLVIDLSTDARLPQNARDDFAAVAQKVIRGLDFLPDDNSSLVALLDDATRLAKVIATHETHLPADIAQQERPVVHYILHQQDDYSPRC